MLQNTRFTCTALTWTSRTLAHFHNYYGKREWAEMRDTGCKKQLGGDWRGTCQGGINCCGAFRYNQRISNQPWKSSQSSHPEAPRADSKWCTHSEHPQPLAKHCSQSGLLHPSPRVSNNTRRIYSACIQQRTSWFATAPRKRQLCTVLPTPDLDILFSFFN